MTLIRRWELTITAALCTVAGLLVGGIVAGGAGGSPGNGEAAEGGRHGHLSPATLANLGVRVEEIQTTSWFRTVSVAAVVVGTSSTEQPVYAPIGGRVENLGVEPGEVVEPGGVVLTLVRDPLPRPQLTLTADVLRPAQERLHETVLDLRKSVEEVRIAKTELERVERFTGKVGGRDLPILPRQRAIDLRYQLSRAEKAHEQARLELRKHGLTEEQISAIEGGEPLPEFNEEMWQRALSRNGLWPPVAQRLADVLPADLRVLPWVTATIGELAATGLATDDLTAWVANPEVGHHFLDIGVLLQRGYTIEDLKRLHDLNALEPIVRVVAPELGPDEEWDVLDIGIRRGAKVEAGDRLLTLEDPRRLLLRTEPVGNEVAAILAAARDRHEIVAKPLVKGAGPVLEGLTVSYVQSAPENDGTLAFVEFENSVSARIDHGDGSQSRTWAVREGMRYLLRVPMEEFDRVFVLPASAVTEIGPDQVVFLQDGDEFRPIPVTLVYRDDEVAVVPATRDVELFPGDPVVQSGAFELGLALRGGDAPDAHAGHNH